MLEGLRKASRSLVGRIIATILFGILIVSFAIWGIGDIFRGGPQNNIARVGGTDITIDQFRTAYNNEIQRLGRQFRTALTPQQARALGIDQRVLGRLINEAILNERAGSLGLSVSDELVVRSILDEPAFRGANGQFDRAVFDDVLRNAGLSEAGFVREQRAALTRQHLADALTGALPVPDAGIEALHRYVNERRSASYLILNPAAAGEIPAPADVDLQAFFEERKASFRAPEYRSVTLLTLDASALAKPSAVSDADARQRYERDKSKFGTPERRRIQQIVFPSRDEAQAAASRLKDGLSFEALATERNIGAQDLELGTFTRSEILDPAVADAAFGLPGGGISDPVDGRFGIVLVRVAEIQPEAVRSFEEVAGDVRAAIATERARGELDAVHDAIEDMRASARPLAEIAREKGLEIKEIPALDRNGLDKQGNAVALPEQEALSRAIFDSDIGVDNEALRTRAGGFVWFDVTKIEPTRDRPLAEVREDVVRQWRETAIADRLAEKARQFVDRLGKGETIEALAAESGTTAKSATELARRSPKDDLSADAVARIFATPEGKAGSAANGPDSRAVFMVTGATVPPLLRTTQEAQRLEDQLRDGMSDDIVAQFLAAVQRDLSVTINQNALRQVVGGEV